MSDSTRRGFLIMAGAGAATVGAAAIATPALAQSPSSQGPINISGSLVAFVRDVDSGEVSVMVGEHEVIVHDRELVKRLARIAS